MTSCLFPLPLRDLHEPVNTEETHSAIESGHILFLPHYHFSLQSNEPNLLRADLLAPKRKNISYDYKKQCLAGYYASTTETEVQLLRQMMHRFAIFSHVLVTHLLPQYDAHLIWGRTSFRPAEIKDRKTSKRKDDTRLHVDAFASTPVNGLRLLRVFCNIHPQANPRVWHVGEPFSVVFERFKHHIPRYNPLWAKLLHRLKITKSLRSAYDHHMLYLHDLMKCNTQYQQNVNKQSIDFPAGTTWIVFTDQVSHAALAGQFLMEQTFYLPVEAMVTPDLSPFNLLMNTW